MLNTLYAALLAEGGRTTREADLSPRTVRYIHTIIHRALKDAVKWGRLAPNPADAADPVCAGPTLTLTAAGRRSGRP